MTKHVDSSGENVDKACLSISRAIRVSGESVIHISEDQATTRPVQESEWSDIQATEATIADVREVGPPQAEAGSLDISVVNDTQEQGTAPYCQP